tara:strand:+ start:3700 stop:3861 length:162 start_codon:yes stop_codon:yes gene_type:complete
MTQVQEHDKIAAQRAKTKLGKQIEGLFHTKRRSAVITNRRAVKRLPKKTKKKS